MFSVKETHQLLKLHEKLHSLTLSLNKLTLDGEVFVVDDVVHSSKIEGVQGDILSTLDEISLIWNK